MWIVLLPLRKLYTNVCLCTEHSIIPRVGGWSRQRGHIVCRGELQNDNRIIPEFSCFFFPAHAGNLTAVSDRTHFPAAHGLRGEVLAPCCFRSSVWEEDSIAAAGRVLWRLCLSKAQEQSPAFQTVIPGWPPLPRVPTRMCRGHLPPQRRLLSSSDDIYKEPCLWGSSLRAYRLTPEPHSRKYCRGHSLC